MSKFICQICGYVYDEAAEKVRFDELPDDWTCPLCGAPKDMFKKAEDSPAEKQPDKKPAVQSVEADDEMREISAGELAAIFSNLARGCEKQYKPEESALYSELAAYYTAQVVLPDGAEFETLADGIKDEFETDYPTAKSAAEGDSDRGAKRILVWSEKVTRMISSLLARYAKEGDAMLEGARIWVCDICGFIYIGETPPAVCPICKVPSFKILEVGRV